MSRGHDGLIALSGALAAALLAAWLAAGGWSEPAAVRLAATTAMAWQVPDFALNELVLAYPHLWLLSSLLLGGISQAVAAAGQALLAASAIGLTVALWYGLLRRFGWPALLAIFLTGLCLAHPFSLWIVSRGGMDSVALLAASVLVMVLARLARGFEPRHLVVLALVLGAGLLLDPRWALYALVLIPCLPLLVGRAWLDALAPGVLIVTVVPVLGALIFLASVGWIFGGRPLDFLVAGGPMLEGAIAAAGAPDAFGGGPVAVGSALLWSLTGTLAGAPLLGWALWCQCGRRRALALLAALLPTAGLVASLALGAGWRELDFVHVAVASSVLAIALTRRFLSPHVLIGLALAGHFGGWLVLPPLGGERVATWQAALVHAPVAAPFDDERALAAFLADGPLTLLDDVRGFPLVAALGADGPLLLPPSPGFASQLILPIPTIAQLAVPAPSQALAGRDRLARRHPGIWAEGLPGYRLVYDHPSWRVWRRAAPGDPATAELRRCLTEPADRRLKASGLIAISCPR
jgi:membrane protein XagC